MEELTELTKSELTHIAWEQLGVRVAPNATSEQIHELLSYRLEEEDLPVNLVNKVRKTLVEFIQAHKEQLSLPCAGNCFDHTDGTVMSCYHQFIEDRNAEHKINEEML